MNKIEVLFHFKMKFIIAVILFSLFVKSEKILRFYENTPVHNDKYKLYQLNCIDSQQCSSGFLPDFIECVNEDHWLWICKSDDYDIRFVNIQCNWKDKQYISNTCRLFYTFNETDYMKYIIRLIIFSIVLFLLGIIYKLKVKIHENRKKHTINGKIEKFSPFRKRKKIDNNLYDLDII